jgi:inosine-uridine nucleoside N-ribohydrolase
MKRKTSQFKRLIKIQEIIIDTDPGYDDALALMLTVKSEMFKIHVITTV